MNFMEFILVFHGRVGPRRICCLCSDILLVVYIYIWMCVQLTFVMQVAACLFLYCVLVSLFCSDFDWN